VDAVAATSSIARALAGLRARDREIVLLHAWAEFDYQQIGAALGIPIGTVRSRLSRARTRVRELLRAGGQFLDDNNESKKERSDE
jgi:RNA polymerase sigma-70 factor (ECF subfamily)